MTPLKNLGKKLNDKLKKTVDRSVLLGTFTAHITSFDLKLIQNKLKF